MDSLTLGSMDAQVTHVRLRMSRNLAGLRMPAACSLQERREVERVLSEAFLQLTGTLEGEYLPLKGSKSHAGKEGGMGAKDEQRLRTLGKPYGFLFEEPKDPMLLAMGFGRDWPDARGVFAACQQGLAAMVNEEDHVTLVATAQGDDLKPAVGRLCACEKALAF